jgi:hypothetical protein
VEKGVNSGFRDVAKGRERTNPGITGKILLFYSTRVIPVNHRERRRAKIDAYWPTALAPGQTFATLTEHQCTQCSANDQLSPGLRLS